MADLEIVGFWPKSLTDWPGKPSAVVLVPGCNFRCGYCYSGAIVTAPQALPRIPEKEILQTLLKKNDSIRGIVVTGGEPTLHGARLNHFLSACQEMGYLTRIETNGSNPFALRSLIQDELLDSLVLDLKAPLYPEKYFEATQKKGVLSKIKTAIALTQRSGIDIEYRIVVVPGVHSFRDVFSLAKNLKNAKRVVLQQFSPANGTLNAEFSQKTKTEYDYLLALAQGIERLHLGIREIKIKTDKGEETVNTVHPPQTLR